MDCIKILALWRAVKAHVDIEKYLDKNWCAQPYTTDEYFAYVLCWAGWNAERTEKV